LKRFLSRPSPALVIACIALFMAMGGVGYAAATIGSRQIKNNSVRGKDIRNGTIASRDVKRNGIGGRAISETKLGPVNSAQGLTQFAVVGANGVPVRGRGISSGSRTGTGAYQVIFNRNVRGCGYFATLGSVGATTPNTGQVSVGQLASNVNGVIVRTTGGGSSAENKSFHLTVSC
jgi:hypothetical protein